MLYLNQVVAPKTEITFQENDELTLTSPKGDKVVVRADVNGHFLIIALENSPTELIKKVSKGTRK